MIALILTLALTARDPLPIVEVCEINTTPTIRQIILYRWTWLPTVVRSHRVSQWWIVKTEPTIERRHGMWLVSSEGRRFIVRSLRRTRTQYDPEVLDRSKLSEDSRRAYIETP
jgi:hypothetical protein